MAIELGLLDGFSDAEVSTRKTAEVYDEHIREAQLSEELGYQYYFFIEHQNANFACVTAPSVYLASLARETSKLRIGPMVYQIPLYHPVRLAQDAATVDHLSHGRLEFGIGYGTRVDEFRRWHLPYAERREMGVEALEIVLKCWTEPSVSYEGAYWQLDEATPTPKPYQEPHPPIWVGAHSPTSFDYAAEHNFHVAQNIDVDDVVAEKFAYFRQSWQSHGHEGPMPKMMLARHVHVADTDEQARAEAEPHLIRGMRPIGHAAPVVAQRPAEEMTAERKEFARVYQNTAGSYEFWIDNGLAIVGSPETVARRIKVQQDKTGHDVFCAQHQIADMSRDLVHNSLKLFGEAVIPALR